MASKLELQPGDITEAEFQRMMNVTRFTTRKWRIDGLPYRKIGKFIVYKESDIRPWLKAKFVSNVMRMNSEVIMVFEDDFRYFTEIGESAAVSVRETMEKALANPALSDEQRQQLNEAIDLACIDVITKMQAVAVYKFAKELQRATPHFVMTHPSFSDAPYSQIKLDDQTITTVRLLVKQIERLSDQQVDHLLAIMETAYESFTAKDKGSDDDPAQTRFFDDLPKANVAGG